MTQVNNHQQLIDEFYSQFSPYSFLPAELIAPSSNEVLIPEFMKNNNFVDTNSPSSGEDFSSSFDEEFTSSSDKLNHLPETLMNNSKENSKQTGNAKEEKGKKANKSKETLVDKKTQLSQRKRGKRRKIEIQYIEDKNKRFVAFSKRKSSLIKKGYEFSELTGTELLILMATPNGNVFSFSTSQLQDVVLRPEGQALIASCLNKAKLNKSNLNMEQGTTNNLSSSSSSTASPTSDINPSDRYCTNEFSLNSTTTNNTNNINNNTSSSSTSHSHPHHPHPPPPTTFDSFPPYSSYPYPSPYSFVQNFSGPFFPQQNDLYIPQQSEVMIPEMSSPIIPPSPQLENIPKLEVHSRFLSRTRSGSQSLRFIPQTNKQA